MECTVAVHCHEGTDSFVFQQDISDKPVTERGSSNLPPGTTTLLSPRLPDASRKYVAKKTLHEGNWLGRPHWSQRKLCLGRVSEACEHQMFTVAVLKRLDAEERVSIVFTRIRIGLQCRGIWIVEWKGQQRPCGGIAAKDRVETSKSA